MLSHDEILAELRRRRDEGAIRNRDVQRLLGLPSSRVSEIFKGGRALSVDEARKLADELGLGSAEKVVRVDFAKARRARGITLDQLARLMGERPDAIADVERRGEAPPDWAERVATAIGITASELLAGGAYDPARRVPLVGSIPGGNWQLAVEDPLALVPCESGGPYTFALTVTGDSMDKFAPPGSRVYIDPENIDLVNGARYAVMNGEGETTFKRYNADKMMLTPESSNEEHKPIQIGREPFTIIGRVIGRWISDA